MTIQTDDFENVIETNGWDIEVFCFDNIGRRSYFKDKCGNNFGEAWEWYLDDWKYWVKRKRK